MAGRGSIKKLLKAKLVAEDAEDELIAMAVALTAAAMEAIALLDRFLLDEQPVDRQRPWGGSPKGRAPNANRDFAGAYKRVMENYFSSDGSKYNEEKFERRFRMSRHRFALIYQRIQGRGSFVIRRDAAHVTGIHPLVRMVAVLRVLAYDMPADSLDENLEMSETVVIDSVKEFCQLLVEEFGPQFLNRGPSPEEKTRSIALCKKQGFPGCFASWDCKHHVWKNCPKRLQGQHKGHAFGGKSTLILEAIVDPDLYFWHVFFGEPGSLNDLNVLGKSSIVTSLLNGTFDIEIPQYVLNGNGRDWLYFLADGIYPNWTIFVKACQCPITPPEKFFSERQESSRKSVERGFGVIVQRFGILAHPIKWWYLDEIQSLVNCCVIIHNMIVTDRRAAYNEADEAEVARILLGGAGHGAEEQAAYQYTLFDYPEVPQDEHGLMLSTLLGTRIAHLDERIQDREAHLALRNDLQEHLWAQRHNPGGR